MRLSLHDQPTRQVNLFSTVALSHSHTLLHSCSFKDIQSNFKIGQSPTFVLWQSFTFALSHLCSYCLLGHNLQHGCLNLQGHLVNLQDQSISYLSTMAFSHSHSLLHSCSYCIFGITRKIRMSTTTMGQSLTLTLSDPNELVKQLCQSARSVNLLSQYHSTLSLLYSLTLMLILHLRDTLEDHFVNLQDCSISYFSTVAISYSCTLTLMLILHLRS